MLSLLRQSPQGMLAHCFLVSGSDIVDFSVGDWHKNSLEIPDDIAESPIWNVTPPDYFWEDRSHFVQSNHTPDLGHAFYTGFKGNAPDMIGLVKEFIRDNEALPLREAMAAYCLPERLSLET